MSYQRFNCSGSTGLTGKFHRGQQQPQTCARHALVVRSNKFASCRPAASLSATVAVEAALFTSVVAALINSYRPCGWSDQRLVSVGLACLRLQTKFRTAISVAHNLYLPTSEDGFCSKVSLPADHLPGVLQVQQSAVHDRGVFARCPISKGTVLGCYPGVKRSTPHMVCKISRHPRAKAYAYGTGLPPLLPSLVPSR